MISKQVKILLYRMETNPEEFNSWHDYSGISKWETFMPKGEAFKAFTLIEKTAVYFKYKKVIKITKKKRAYDAILERLIETPEETKNRYFADGKVSVATYGNGGGGIGLNPAQQAWMDHARAKLK